MNYTNILKRYLNSEVLVIPKVEDGDIMSKRKQRNKLMHNRKEDSSNIINDIIYVAKKKLTLKKLMSGITLLGLIGLLISMTNCSLNATKPYFSGGSAYFEKAVEAYEREDFLEAETLFKNAKNADPRLKEIEYYLGKIQHKYYNNRIESLKYYSKVPKDDPKYELSIRELVWYYYEKGDYVNLERYLPTLLEINPQSVYGRLANNAVLTKNNDMRGLEKESKKTIEYYAFYKDGRSTFDAMKGSFETRKYDKETKTGNFSIPDTFYQQLALFVANANLSGIEYAKGDLKKAKRFIDDAVSVYLPVRTNSSVTINLNPDEYVSYFEKNDSPIVSYSIPTFTINGSKYYFVPLKAIVEAGIKEFSIDFYWIEISKEQVDWIIMLWEKSKEWK